MKHTSTLFRHFSALVRSTEQRLKFPRESGNLSYALNWQLAKYYVTPLNSVYLNSASGSSGSTSKNDEIEVINEADPYLREHALMLIGSNISRSGEVYAERGFIGEKAVCFITKDKQVAGAVRSKLGSQTHEDTDAIGVIFSSEVEKYGSAAIVDQEKRIVALTGLNFSELEKIVADL